MVLTEYKWSGRPDWAVLFNTEEEFAALLDLLKVKLRAALCLSSLGDSRPYAEIDDRYAVCALFKGSPQVIYSDVANYKYIFTPTKGYDAVDRRVVSYSEMDRFLSGYGKWLNEELGN